MQTSTKLMIAGALIVLPILAITISNHKSAGAPMAAATPAPARPMASAPPAGAKRMGPADTNGDGMLSKQEWMSMAQFNAERNFSQFDLNHDGTVTRQEINTVKAQRRARWEAWNKARMAKQAQMKNQPPKPAAAALAPAAVPAAPVQR